MPPDDLPPLISAYLDFARQRPELFETPPQGVRILLDPGEIAAVQREIACSLHERGLPESGAEVGIVFEDPWFRLLRDAVEFPDGSRRLHTRIINFRGDNIHHTSHGVAVLPMFEGRLVVTRQFRHAPRRFLLEIPRGANEPGHSLEETARNEVFEEIGGEVTDLTRLGFLYGSSNIYFSGAYLFFARLSKVGAPQLYEGIVAVEQYSVAEFEKLLTDGELTDAFTVAAYAHAKVRGLV